MTLLLLGYTTETQLKALVSYMFVEGNTENCSALLEKLAQRAPKHRETLMTIAEQLEQKGREEGQRIAAQRIAQTLLKEGLDREKVSAITGVAVEELQQQAH